MLSSARRHPLKSFVRFKLLLIVTDLHLQNRISHTTIDQDPTEDYMSITDCCSFMESFELDMMPDPTDYLRHEQVWMSRGTSLTLSYWTTILHQ